MAGNGSQTGKNSFSLNLTKFAARTEVEMKQVVQKIAMEAFGRVILRTPVDTGRARANWGCTIGSPRSGGPTEDTDKSGAATRSAVSDTVQQFPGDGSVFLTNSLPYINELENGSSRQMPSGMVRATVAEMAGFLGSKATLQSLKKATRPE